jgi:hypothetical protein
MLRQTFLLLPAALIFCLAACKKEPDLPDDPHVPLVNPFIGVWNDGGEYWQFKRDGTGGRAATETGPFDNDDVKSFSFLFFDGKGTQAAKPSLVILEGSPLTVTLYTFLIGNNQALLIPGGGEGGVSVTLERVNGSPQVISLTNQLIGEWSADWSYGGEHGAYSTWSLKYYADGTVKVFHHGVGHQFENAYALRENTLVIFGAWRFGIAPVIGELTQQGDDTWQLTETQTNPGPASWVYTKVAAAEWM